MSIRNRNVSPKETAQSFLLALDELSSEVGHAAAVLKYMSETRPVEVKVPINYSIRFTQEVYYWLKAMSIEAGDLQWMLKDNDVEGDLQLLSNIQRAATSVLDGARKAFERARTRSDTKQLDNHLEQQFLDLAQVTNVKSATKEEKAKKKELDQESGQSFNIRFTPTLAAWLKDMAETQTRLTGQTVSIQQAANTILLLACRTAHKPKGTTVK